jgi:hypothetical protein
MSNAPIPHYPLNALINAIASNHPQSHRRAQARAMAHQVELIRREFEETQAGYRDLDMRQIRDGLGDVIVTVDGMYHRLMLSPPTSPVEVVVDQEATIPMFFHAIDVLLGLVEQVAEYGLIQSRHDTFADEDIKLDLYSVRLALEGILSAVYSASAFFDIPVMADQQAIFNSNLSKFDTDLETAERTVQKYADMGVITALYPQVVSGTTYYVVKCSELTPEAKALNITVGKFLKSVNFAEPVFSDLIKPMHRSAELEQWAAETARGIDRLVSKP